MFQQANFPRILCMSRCPVAGAFDKDGKTHLVYCGKWSCPRCRVRNANKWARRAKKAVTEFSGEDGGELWFLTLTLGSGVRTPSIGYSLLPSLWDTTRKQYQRYYGNFSYLAFVEGQPHRSYMPHFHILTDREPPTRRGRSGHVTKRTLHDWAHSIGWGYQAELLIVNSEEAFAYVAKYASKGSSGMPRNFRRVRPSKDWPKDDDPKGGSWIVPSRKEDVPHFLVRAADFTGLAIEDCYEAYTALMIDIKINQLDASWRL